MTTGPVELSPELEQAIRRIAADVVDKHERLRRAEAELRAAQVGIGGSQRHLELREYSFRRAAGMPPADGEPLDDRVRRLLEQILAERDTAAAAAHTKWLDATDFFGSSPASPAAGAIEPVGAVVTQGRSTADASARPSLKAEPATSGLADG